MTPRDATENPGPPEHPADLSPHLRLLYEFELSLGNEPLRVERGLWSGSPLAVIFRDPLHFEQAAQLNISPRVTRWENHDTHYDLEAGWRCAETRHTLAGPLNPSAVDKPAPETDN